MRRQRHRSGGILWDAFLIVFVCVAGFWAWRTRDRWIKYLNQLPGVAGWLNSGKRVKPPTVRLDRQSALAQTRTRQFLVQSGVGEKNIFKSFNEERREGDVSWIESTLEITRPKGFQGGPFLKKVIVFLSDNDLSLMRDETDRGTWTLEFGDRTHVFQRLVIRDRSSWWGNHSSAPRSDDFKGGNDS